MRNLLVYLLILFTTTAHAAKPDWVKNFGRSEKRPIHIYLVGFGSAWGSGAEPRQIAADNARADVSRQHRHKGKERHSHLRIGDERHSYPSSIVELR